MPSYYQFPQNPQSFEAVDFGTTEVHTPRQNETVAGVRIMQQQALNRLTREQVANPTTIIHSYINDPNSFNPNQLINYVVSTASFLKEETNMAQLIDINRKLKQEKEYLHRVGVSDKFDSRHLLTIAKTRMMVNMKAGNAALYRREMSRETGQKMSEMIKLLLQLPYNEADRRVIATRKFKADDKDTIHRVLRGKAVSCTNCYDIQFIRDIIDGPYMECCAHCETGLTTFVPTPEILALFPNVKPGKVKDRSETVYFNDDEDGAISIPTYVLPILHREGVVVSANSKWYEKEYYNKNKHIFSFKIGQYHELASRVIGHIPSYADIQKPALRLGLELEVIAKNGDQQGAAFYAFQKLNEGMDAPVKYACMEHDGSLPDGGFEIITSYTGLMVHEERLKALKTFHRKMYSFEEVKCGLHVHIDKAGMMPLHAGKLSVFVNSWKNTSFFAAITGRTFNTYCQQQPVNLKIACSRSITDKITKTLMRSSTRHAALHITGKNTIEFRMFKGTLKYEAVMAALELTKALWLYTRDCSLTALNYNDFIVWLKYAANPRETRFLKARLQEKGFLQDKVTARRLEATAKALQADKPEGIEA